MMDWGRWLTLVALGLLLLLLLSLGPYS